MLKLRTIRRQGTIAVLGRNLAVRVLIEKTARVESRDATVGDVDPEGSRTAAGGAGGCSFVAAPRQGGSALIANPAGVVRRLRAERDG
jgi:hypothetical protein